MQNSFTIGWQNLVTEILKELARNAAFFPGMFRAPDRSSKTLIITIGFTQFNPGTYCDIEYIRKIKCFGIRDVAREIFYVSSKLVIQPEFIFFNTTTNKNPEMSSRWKTIVEAWIIGCLK